MYADAAGTDDLVTDAKHSSRSEYKVVSSTLSVAKTITTLCDPVNGTTGPKNIPLGMVRWTITIANSGGASANLTTIADSLLASPTTFDPDLITGAGGAAGCEFAAAGAGTPESANGRGVKITNTVARTMAGSAGGAAVLSSFYTGAADLDGVDYNVTTAGSVTANLATALPAGGVGPAAYTAGELKAGETLTIYFNVGIN